MGWMPLLKYTFENHAAVDESGNGSTGMVELPGPDRWIDLPAKGIATAVRYDNVRSKITVPNRPQFAGWQGFRVNVIFQPGEYDHRINLVEGDASFAFFIERDGSLQGTINDGHRWYGVATPPGTIIPHNWYTGEFLYDPSTMLILRLNGSLMQVEVTHGDPVLPVGPEGIKIGYWPGGDDRYTFIGLIGPVSIDTLNPRDTLISTLGKLVCGDSGNLETLLPVIENELSPQEKQGCDDLGVALVESVKHLVASIVGTSPDQGATLKALREISDQATTLLIQDEEKEVDLFKDPALGKLLNDAYKLMVETSPNVENTLIAETIKLIGLRPLTEQRLQEILRLHPEICAAGPGSSGFSPGGLGGAGDPISGIISKICELCESVGESGKPGHSCPPPVPPTCSGHEPGASVKAAGCEVHVHVHYDPHNKEKKS